MVKVIGAKISDDLYERISRLGNKSDFVRLAIEEYFHNHPELWSNPGVNEGKPGVNHQTEVIDDEDIDIDQLGG